MKSWSGIRKTLEQDRLAPSLQGRVRYLATRYRGAHDDMGRIALLIDGQEVFSAHPFQAPSVDWAGIKEQHPDLSCEERAEKYWNLSLEEGIGDRGDFYRAFREYDAQDVAESLQSEDPLVRVLAVLDRRVGKRRLAALRDRGFADEPEWVQRFYRLRLEAEDL